MDGRIVILISQELVDCLCSQICELFPRQDTAPLIPLACRPAYDCLGPWISRGFVEDLMAGWVFVVRMDDDEEYWNQSDASKRKVNFDALTDDDDLAFFGISKGVKPRSFNYDSSETADTIMGGDIFDPGSQFNDNYESARVKPSLKHEPSSAKRQQRPVTATEIAKLEAEVDSLQRKLKDEFESKWAPLPANRLVLRIIMGEPYSLDSYKSKKQKLDLLDTALKFHDGNAIIAAVLLMKNTLKATIFNQEMMCRPEAMDHYLSYLNTHQEYSELSDVLSMLGKASDAAILNYKLALRSKELKMRSSNLKNCYANHFQNLGCSNDAFLLGEHISLLDKQSNIEKSDLKLRGYEVSNQQSQELVKKRPSIINSSLISTLHYCCIYHYGQPESHFASPQAMRNLYKLTDKQFAWTAIVGRAELKQWKDVEVLLTTKGLFGNSKIKFVIPPAKLLDILLSNDASTEELNKYVSKVDNVEQRLKLAKKYKCHRVVVDTLVSLKDKQQLIEYQSHVLAHSTDARYVEDAIKALRRK